MSTPTPAQAPVSPSQWPLRQVISERLRNLIIVPFVLPALNAQLANCMETASGQPFQFVPDDISIGDIPNPPHAVICIMPGSEPPPMCGSGFATRTLNTRICLKTPSAGDNDPEDYELIRAAFMDAFADVFWDINTATIPAHDAEGNPYLFAGAKFQNCRWNGTDVAPLPVGEPDKVIRTLGCTVHHTCQILVPIRRVSSLITTPLS